MRVVVPFDATNPKTRLDQVLNDEEREQFANAMIDDVIETIQATGYTPEIIATQPIDKPVSVTVDRRNLDTCINAQLAEGSYPIAIVMADLALISPRHVERFFSLSGDIVIAPGRNGGTNAIIVRSSEFSVDYHGISFLDHLQIAYNNGLSVNEFDSYRFGTDIDEPEDLVEVLLHTDNRSAKYLRNIGLSLDSSTPRVSITRDA
ncbi:MAG: 2-phospho-L-lactate guanylyltransferase [Halobacteriaceae archaeon]